MKIDKEKVKKRISEIREAIKEIEKLTSMDEDEFWSEKRNIAAIKYFLLQAIEAVGSICVHILAKLEGKGVSSLSDCFEGMEEMKIIDKELSLRLKRMAKFRNKLVHVYWKIDDELVYKYAKSDLDDFTQFIESIKKIINLN